MADRIKRDRISRKTYDQNAKREFSTDNPAGEAFHENLRGNDLPTNLTEAIHAHFALLDGVELELPPREFMRDPPDFE